MEVEAFYDPATSTLSYVVYDRASRGAIAIDPVLDYDPPSSKTATTSVERIAAFLAREGLELHHVLETHAHADHLSASEWLKKRFGAKTAIGARIREVQSAFKRAFDLGAAFPVDGGQFDRLLEGGETLEAGALRVKVLATPGHTPACVSYLVGNAVFTGDALLMDDHGTGRCDFPRGSASDLYRSVHDTLYALPDDTRVFVGHDYQPGGRPLAWETTIGRSKERNVQIRAETSEADFVAMREKRDASLSAPRLFFPSVQVNIDAGRLPAARANGVRYLVIPLDLGSEQGIETPGQVEDSKVCA